MESLNSIPLVGHFKGGLHYLKGDIKGGNRAMRAATRTTVVMGAGAATLVAGPVVSGMVAVAAATVWDGAESIATDEATGIIKGGESIIETAAKGKLPAKEILATTVGVTGDVLSGLSGGTLASVPAGETLSRAGHFVMDSFNIALHKEVAVDIAKDTKLGKKYLGNGDPQ